MIINFEAYDNEHPRIWELFVFYSYQTKRKGFSHYSAKAIFELIRWHEGLPKGNEAFKINNIYTADYARKIMEVYPNDFGGFFRTRDLKAPRNKAA